MQIELESSLNRWIQEAILSPEQAARIREFEAARAPRRGNRAAVLIGLALGGIMLAAGVLLFVAAHWMDLSPTQRMALLVFAVGGLHAAGALCADRFPAMAVTLHAVGTAALGGAIFLGGQIFNMQEHWPTGILLWAVGAVAALWLVGGWPQIAFVALLVPFWLIGEWMEAVPRSLETLPVTTAFCATLAICYLSVASRAGRIFAWIGGIAVIPSVLALASMRSYISGTTSDVGWAAALLLPVSFAAVYRGARAWMNAVAAGWVGILSGLAFQHDSIWVYAWCALGSAGMIAWGIYEYRAERVNLGMAGFALTILFFYFSSVMDKLGRSTSLIVLGVVFLAGAWYWEKLRRKLVALVNAGNLTGGVA